MINDSYQSFFTHTLTSPPLPLSLSPSIHTFIQSGRTSCVLKFLLYTVLWMIGILYVSLVITGGSWDFINGVYGVM